MRRLPTLLSLPIPALAANCADSRYLQSTSVLTVLDGKVTHDGRKGGR